MGNNKLTVRSVTIYVPVYGFSHGIHVTDIEWYPVCPGSRLAIEHPFMSTISVVVTDSGEWCSHVKDTIVDAVVIWLNDNLPVGTDPKDLLVLP